MKIRRLLTIFLFLAGSCSIFSQQINGLVTNQKSWSIPFVNIGIAGQGEGTVSDLNGVFYFFNKDSLSDIKLKFSSFGYKSKEVSVHEIMKDSVIKLDTNIVKPNPIVARPDSIKTKILGNIIESSASSTLFLGSSSGMEMGVYIDIKQIPVFLDQFSFYIVENEYDSLPFLVNIYLADENGFPLENLLTQKILVSTHVIQKKVTFDLKPYHLYMKNNFFISLEFLRPFEPGKNLLIASKNYKYTSAYKTASQDVWHKLKNNKTPGFYLNVSY